MKHIITLTYMDGRVDHLYTNDDCGVIKLYDKSYETPKHILNATNLGDVLDILRANTQYLERITLRRWKR